MEKIPVIREPKKITRSRRGSRLLFLLFLFFLTILLVLFFHSSLSKITAIHVEGNRFAAEGMIRQVSGAKINDSFFLVHADRVKRRVEALPEIASVNVKKKFPGQLLIEVEEHKAVALERTASGGFQVVLANGHAVPPLDGQALNYPILTGWEGHEELRRKLCETLGKTEDYLLSDLSEIMPFPSDSYPDKIKIYTRSHFAVITTVSYLPDKMPMLDNVVMSLKQDGNTAGTITMLEVITFQPPEEEGEEAEETAADGESEAIAPAATL